MGCGLDGLRGVRWHRDVAAAEAVASCWREHGVLTAVVGLAGVLVTAAVSLIGLMITRQSNRRLSRESEQAEHRLRLDAAMRAGALFSAKGSEPVAPASIASSLLTLTKLGH